MAERVEREDHKYYIRIETSPKKYRYFYSKAEYDAYLANKRKKTEEKSKGFLSGLIDSGKKLFSSITNSISDAAKSVSSTIKKATNRAASFMTQTIGSLKVTFNKAVETGKEFVEKTFKYFAKVGEGAKARYFYSKEEYEAFINKGKEFVGNFFTSKTQDLINVGKTIADVVLNGVGTTILKKVTGTSGFDMAKNLVSNLLKKNGSKKVTTNPSYTPVTTQSTNAPSVKFPLNLKVKKTEDKNSKQEKDSDMKAVNPNFNPKWDDPSYSFTTEQELQNYYDYANNCIACSVTYDLRQRGYDVEAAPLSSYEETVPGISENLVNMYDDPDEYIYHVGNGLTSVTDVWDVPAVQSVYERKNMCENIRDQCKYGGDDARGVLLIQWSPPNSKSYIGGHAISYEIDNGTVYIRDCQRNLYQTMDEYLEDNSDYIGRLSAVRLDNSAPNNLATRWVIDSERKGQSS